MLSVKRITMLVALAAFVAAGAAVATAKKPPSGFKTTTKAYLVGVPGTGFTTEPLLTAGDLVPVTGSPNEDYQMVGIPDGLGAVRAQHGVARVFMNHELNSNVESHPYVDRAEHQRGAFISEYRLARDGSVLSGRRAFDTVFQDDTLVGRRRTPPTRLGPSAASAPASWRAARPASTVRST